jgi:hypothetical protein
MPQVSQYPSAAIVPPHPGWVQAPDAAATGAPVGGAAATGAPVGAGPDGVAAMPQVSQ